MGYNALKLSIFLVCVFLTHSSSVYGMFEEPKCSKFHFEEQVLEKLVVLDHNVKVSIQDFAKKIENFKAEMVQFRSDFSTFKSMVEGYHTEKINSMKNDIQKFEENVDNMINTQNNRLEGFMGRAEEDMRNMNNNINETVETAIEEMQAKVNHRPIAFIATGVTNINPAVGSTLVFTTDKMNAGEAYSTTTGHFVAPVAGTYMFSVQICICSGKTINYQILSDERIYSATDYGDKDVDDACSSVTTVGVLKKGETIRVMCTNVEGTNALEADDGNNFWTMFTGALVNTYTE